MNRTLEVEKFFIYFRGINLCFLCLLLFMCAIILQLFYLCDILLWIVYDLSYDKVCDVEHLRTHPT